MRIAIIGAGISGMVAAYLLSEDHNVVVFEANNYIGGHTHTVNVAHDEVTYPVDTGFIVCNEKTYPNFLTLMQHYLLYIMVLAGAFLAQPGQAASSTASSYASPESQIKFQRIGLEQGLSQLTVLCMTQDRQGFLWFGTSNGLNRYDGYSFKVYTYRPGDEQSLSHNAIRAIHEDRDGILWIGTQGGGLNRFDRETGVFTQYRHDPGDPQHSLHGNVVYAAHEDRQGVLWVGSGGTILIVDDQLDNLKVLIAYLKECEFDLMAAPSGEMALKQVERFQPDLILLDVLMPGGLDGFETCRRLKANPATQPIPIIFLTAVSDTSEKVKGFEAGGVDYLTKPLQHQEVSVRIGAYLTIRNLQRELQQENERFRQLSRATFEGIIIHADDTILEVNQAACTLFGYTHKELVRKALRDLLRAPDEQTPLEYHRRAGDDNPFEAKAHRRDGSTFPVEIQTKRMPWQDQEVQVAAIRDITWRKVLEQQNLAMKACLKNHYRFGDIIGKSPAMQQVYESIVYAASSEANVLIQGDSGTGKELVARTIHQRGPRYDNPFVIVNCGAISSSLFEREFFGHRKGAFTNADRDTPGFFDAAGGGTLFLDEIGELSSAMQVALLRVLETREYTPVGDTRARLADVRILAATNRSLEEEIRQGRIREDFYYRLHVISIALPPLRDRREDISLLIEHLLEQQQQQQGGALPKLPPNVFNMLVNYDWPGNVRELQNELHSYLNTGKLSLRGIRKAPDEPLNQMITAAQADSQHRSLSEIVGQVEKQVLLETLQTCQWHRGRAADTLSIDRKTLYKKLKKYQLI